MALLEFWVRPYLNAELPERVTTVAMIRLKFGYPTAREVTDKATTCAPRASLPSFADYFATKTICFDFRLLEKFIY